jgi:polyhydroxyalkanoate synthesis repressor PhaR
MEKLMARKSAKQAARSSRKRGAQRTAARTIIEEDNQPPADDRVIIKRYGNRRLYNTETGSYVTYQDLISIIRAGNDIQVIDSTTKADVTKSVLMQAILEEDKNQSLLPLPFLFQILRSRDDSVQDFFKNYLSASFDAYLKTKEEFDRRFRGFLGMGATAPQMWEQFVPGAETLKNIFNPKKDDEEPK